MQDFSAWVGAIVVPNLTVSQPCCPETIKDIVDAGIGENHGGLMGFHGWYQVFILFGNVDNFHML